MAKPGEVYTGRASLFLDGAIVSNPPIVEGDVIVVKADGSVANVTTLPTANANDPRYVEYTLSAEEMAGDPGDTVTLGFEDQAGDAWDPMTIDVHLTDVGASVWTYATRTLTSVEEQVAAIAQAVWEYGARTLTMSWAAIQALFDAEPWALIRGNTWAIPLDLAELGGAGSSAYLFAIKKHPRHESDSAALLFASSSEGLEYLNGKAGTPGQASLTVANGVLTITVEAVATAELPPGYWWYEVREINASGTVTTRRRGRVKLLADVARRTS